MAQRQTNIAIRAPAADGLNTEDSPYGLSEQFATRAENAIIDQSGRLSAREAFASAVTTDNVTRNDYSGVDHTVSTTEMVHMVDSNGNDLLFVAEKSTYSATYSSEYRWVVYNNGQLDEYTYSGTALSGQSLNDPALVPFEGSTFVFSRGNGILEFDGTTIDEVFTGTADVDYILPQDDTGVFSTKVDGDVAIAAYGRIWVSGVNGDDNTIYYSDLLNAAKWYDGRATPADSQNTAGIIDVSEYWPNGDDAIVGMAAHNGFLVIFGRSSILIYSGVQGDPAAEGGLTLQDAIPNVGLVSREAICSTGKDLMFVDETGIRSLGRVIQEKSSPLTVVTGNITNEFSLAVSREADKRDISLEYFVDKDLVVCQFAGQQVAYAVDIRRPASNGNFKVTKWTNTTFRRMCYVDSGNYQGTYLGRENITGASASTYSTVLKYDGYTSFDGAGYDFVYEGPYLTLGDTSVTKFPKRVDFTVTAAQAVTNFITEWGFTDGLDYSKTTTHNKTGLPEFGVAEFGVDKWGGDGDDLVRFRVNMKGRGPAIQLAHTTTIETQGTSIVEINLQLLTGRIY